MESIQAEFNPVRQDFLVDHNVSSLKDIKRSKKKEKNTPSLYAQNMEHLKLSKKALVSIIQASLMFKFPLTAQIT